MKKINYLLLMATLLIGSVTTTHAATPTFVAPKLPTIPNISASVQAPEVKIEAKYLPKVVFDKKSHSDILVKWKR